MPVKYSLVLRGLLSTRNERDLAHDPRHPHRTVVSRRPPGPGKDGELDDQLYEGYSLGGTYSPGSPLPTLVS